MINYIEHKYIIMSTLSVYRANICIRKYKNIPFFYYTCMNNEPVIKHYLHASCGSLIILGNS